MFSFASVMQWALKREFANMLKKHIQTAEDRYLTYALMHTYPTSPKVPTAKIVEYKRANRNYTVKWAVERMVRVVCGVGDDVSRGVECVMCGGGYMCRTG